jgi:hypothetical protein
MDDGQKTPRGHFDFNSHVKILHVLVFRTDRQMDGQTDREINWVWASLTTFLQVNINIEEVCNSIVHPITKEMITKYTKLMDDPALKGPWVPAMSKEQHRLAQGKEGVTVCTNTIF